MTLKKIDLKPTTSTLTKLLDRTRENIPSDINTQLLQTNAMMYINKDEKLAEYAEKNPMEVAQHLYNFVTLGLDVYRKDAYLLFYGGKLTPIIDYKGLIALVIKYSVEDILKIDFDMIHENDKVNMKNGEFTHEYNPFKERGNRVGVYCSVHFANGAVKYTTMTKEEIDKVRKVSPSANSPYSPWVKWEDSMWIKTVIRNAMKTIPLDFGKQDKKYAEVLQKSYDNSDKDIDFSHSSNRENHDDIIQQDDNVVEAEVTEKVVYE